MSSDEFTGVPRAELIEELIDERSMRFALYGENKSLQEKLRLLDVGDGILPTAEAIEKKFEGRISALRAEIHRLKRENQVVIRELKLVRGLRDAGQGLNQALARVSALQVAVANTMHPILTVRETAELLKCSPGHVKNLNKRRILPAVRIGRRIRFRRETVLKVIAELEDKGRGWFSI